MGTHLGSKTIGGADNAFKWYLHTNGINLASKPRISNGEGNDTGLVVGGNTIGVHNAGGFKTMFTGLATADRTVSFPDADGTVVLNDGSGVTDPSAFRAAAVARTVKKLQFDMQTSSVHPVQMGPFSFTPEASKTYCFKFIMRVQSPATNTGVKLMLHGPLVEFVTYSVNSPYAQSGHTHQYQATFDALDETINPSYFYEANAQGLFEISGIAKVASAPPAGNFRLTFASEVSGNQVGVLEGSTLIFEEV